VKGSDNSSTGARRHGRPKLTTRQHVRQVVIGMVLRLDFVAIREELKRQGRRNSPAVLLAEKYLLDLETVRRWMKKARLYWPIIEEYADRFPRVPTRWRLGELARKGKPVLASEFLKARQEPLPGIDWGSHPTIF
jgi:hypothetical protein